MVTETIYYDIILGKIYLQKKTPRFKKKAGKIKCRSCGNSNIDNLTIHHVVPRVIGKAFGHEAFLKCPTVVICNKCHKRYEKTADKVKEGYAIDLNINIHEAKTIRNPILHKLEYFRHVKRAAKALLAVTDSWSSSVTVDKRVNTILNYLEAPYYTHSDLLRIVKLKTDSNGFSTIPNPNYINLGEALMEYYTIEEITKFWVEHWHKFESKVQREQIYKRQKYNSSIIYN